MGREGRHFVPMPRFQSFSLPSSVSPEFSMKEKRVCGNLEAGVQNDLPVPPPFSP